MMCGRATVMFRTGTEHNSDASGRLDRYKLDRCKGERSCGSRTSITWCSTSRTSSGRWGSTPGRWGSRASGSRSGGPGRCRSPRCGSAGPRSSTWSSGPAASPTWTTSAWWWIRWTGRRSSPPAPSTSSRGPCRAGVPGVRPSPSTCATPTATPWSCAGTPRTPPHEPGARRPAPGSGDRRRGAGGHRAAAGRGRLRRSRAGEGGGARGHQQGRHPPPLAPAAAAGDRRARLGPRRAARPGQRLHPLRSAPERAAPRRGAARTAAGRGARTADRRLRRRPRTARTPAAQPSAAGPGGRRGRGAAGRRARGPAAGRGPRAVRRPARLGGVPAGAVRRGTGRRVVGARAGRPAAARGGRRLRPAGPHQPAAGRAAAPVPLGPLVRIVPGSRALATAGAGAPAGGTAAGQNLIAEIESAIEFRNRLMDGAMPLEARKKPKSMATMAGPGLRFFPLMSTTRMTANSSTTDSEMATTDHTLGRSLSRPGGTARTPARTIVPPTGLVHAAPDMMSDTPPRAGRRPAQEFDGHSTATPAGITRLRFRLHTTCAQVIQIDRTETPYAPLGRDESRHHG
ncbi:hypothetical protein SGPA1_30443 [Streptomyces misionensis JCM 4497]